MLIPVDSHDARERFDVSYPGIHGVTAAELQAQLRPLGVWSEFVSVGDAASAVTTGARLPDRSILVTSDGGPRERFAVARPVLDRLGVPATCEFLALLNETAASLGIRLGEDDGAIAAGPYRDDPPEVARVKRLPDFPLLPSDRDRRAGGATSTPEPSDRCGRTWRAG